MTICIYGVRFEWHEAKNQKNREKHGIDFEFASRVFADPLALIGRNRVDGKTGEQRWQIIGRVADLPVLLVIFVDRTKDDDEKTIRIISARRGSKRECRRYFQQTAH